jgi:Outer membrane lipoprotein-sorting protein
LVLGLCVAATTAFGAETSTLPVPDGAELVERARRAMPSESFGAEFRIDVTTPSWSSRKVGQIFKRKSGSGQDTLIVFQRPPAAEGVKVLMQRPPDGRALQWLVLPNGRPRRLSTSQSGEALLGTEFTSNDLEIPSALSRAVVTRQEHQGGALVFVVAMTVTDEGASHEEVAWIRVDDAVVLRREIYLGSELARVFRVDRMEEVDGVSTPVAMTITNLATHAVSKVFLRHVTYASAFAPSMFTLAQLAEQRASLP